MRIGRLTTISATVLAAGLAVGCAKKEPAPAPAPEPVTIQAEQVVTATATVVKVDQKTRMVTLRGDDGKEFTFKASDEVRNLPQVRAGDTVVANYYEAIAAEIRPPTAGEKANPKETYVTGDRAPVGSRPAAAGAVSTRVVATVTAIDKATQHVTLTGPEGRAVTVKVRDPRNLDAAKVGDTVVITYTEAVGIAVEPAPKKKKK